MSDLQTRFVLWVLLWALLGVGVIYERVGIEMPDIPANFTTPNGNGGGSTHCIDPINHEAVGDEGGTAG